MLDQEVEQLGAALIQKAIANEHEAFVLVQDMTHYQLVKTYRNAMKKVIKGFKRLKKEQKSNTVWDIGITFYKEEIRTLTDMIKEFRCYLWGNRHTLATLFGRPRSEDEMVDYRTLPISLF